MKNQYTLGDDPNEVTHGEECDCSGCADEPESATDDSINFCPDCERPNQFGELCSQCEREREIA